MLDEDLIPSAAAIEADAREAEKLKRRLADLKSRMVALQGYYQDTRGHSYLRDGHIKELAGEIATVEAQVMRASMIPSWKEAIMRRKRLTLSSSLSHVSNTTTLEVSQGIMEVVKACSSVSRSRNRFHAAAAAAYTDAVSNNNTVNTNNAGETALDSPKKSTAPAMFSETPVEPFSADCRSTNRLHDILGKDERDFIQFLVCALQDKEIIMAVLTAPGCPLELVPPILSVSPPEVMEAMDPDEPSVLLYRCLHQLDHAVLAQLCWLLPPNAIFHCLAPPAIDLLDLDGGMSATAAASAAIAVAAFSPPGGNESGVYHTSPMATLTGPSAAAARYFLRSLAFGMLEPLERIYLLPQLDVSDQPLPIFRPKVQSVLQQKCSKDDSKRNSPITSRSSRKGSPFSRGSDSPRSPATPHTLLDTTRDENHQGGEGVNNDGHDMDLEEYYSIVQPHSDNDDDDINQQQGYSRNGLTEYTKRKRLIDKLLYVHEHFAQAVPQLPPRAFHLPLYLAHRCRLHSKHKRRDTLSSPLVLPSSPETSPNNNPSLQPGQQQQLGTTAATASLLRRPHQGVHGARPMSTAVWEGKRLLLEGSHFLERACRALLQLVPPPAGSSTTAAGHIPATQLQLEGIDAIHFSTDEERILNALCTLKPKTRPRGIGGQSSSFYEGESSYGNLNSSMTTSILNASTTFMQCTSGLVDLGEILIPEQPDRRRAPLYTIDDGTFSLFEAPQFQEVLPHALFSVVQRGQAIELRRPVAPKTTRARRESDVAIATPPARAMRAMKRPAPPTIRRPYLGRKGHGKQAQTPRKNDLRTPSSSSVPVQTWATVRGDTPVYRGKHYYAVAIPVALLFEKVAMPQPRSSQSNPGSVASSPPTTPRTISGAPATKSGRHSPPPGSSRPKSTPTSAEDSSPSSAFPKEANGLRIGWCHSSFTAEGAGASMLGEDADGFGISILPIESLAKWLERNGAQFPASRGGASRRTRQNRPAVAVATDLQSEQERQVQIIATSPLNSPPRGGGDIVGGRQSRQTPAPPASRRLPSPLSMLSATVSPESSIMPGEAPKTLLSRSQQPPPYKFVVLKHYNGVTQHYQTDPICIVDIPRDQQWVEVVCGVDFGTGVASFGVNGVHLGIAFDGILRCGLEQHIRATSLATSSSPGDSCSKLNTITTDDALYPAVSVPLLNVPFATIQQQQEQQQQTTSPTAVPLQAVLSSSLCAEDSIRQQPFPSIASQPLPLEKYTIHLVTLGSGGETPVVGTIATVAYVAGNTSPRSPALDFSRPSTRETAQSSTSSTPQHQQPLVPPSCYHYLLHRYRAIRPEDKARHTLVVFKTFADRVERLRQAISPETSVNGKLQPLAEHMSILLKKNIIPAVNELDVLPPHRVPYIADLDMILDEAGDSAAIESNTRQFLQHTPYIGGRGVSLHGEEGPEWDVYDSTDDDMDEKLADEAIVVARKEQERASSCLSDDSEEKNQAASKTETPLAVREQRHRRAGTAGVMDFTRSIQRSTLSPHARAKLVTVRVKSQKAPPLCAALHLGLYDCAELLASMSICNVNIPDEQGNTPLLLCVLKGLPDLLRYLLFVRCAAVTPINYAGYNAVHVALLTEQYECLDILLSHPTAVNAEVINTLTVRKSNCVLLATKMQQLGYMQEFLRRGGEPGKADGNNVNALQHALKYGLPEEYVDTILQYPDRFGSQEVNWRERRGERGTALLRAAAAGQYDVCKFLLEKGASHFVCFEHNKCNPLHCAIIAHSDDCAELILNHLAQSESMDAPTPSTGNPVAPPQRLSAFLQTTEARFGMTALHLACERGMWRTIQLLASLGADVNAQSRTGLTPLMLIAMGTPDERGSVFVTSCRKKLKIELKDKLGNTALIHAAQHGNIPLITILIDSCRADVNVVNACGYTPLTTAIAYNQQVAAETVLLLPAAQKVDITSKHVTIPPPAEFAFQRGMVRLAKLLTELGENSPAAAAAMHARLALLESDATSVPAVVAKARLRSRASIALSNNTGREGSVVPSERRVSRVYMSENAAPQQQMIIRHQETSLEVFMRHRMTYLLNRSRAGGGFYDVAADARGPDKIMQALLDRTESGDEAIAILEKIEESTPTAGPGLSGGGTASARCSTVDGPASAVPLIKQRTSLSQSENSSPSRRRESMESSEEGDAGRRSIGCMGLLSSSMPLEVLVPALVRLFQSVVASVSSEKTMRQSATAVLRLLQQGRTQTRLAAFHPLCADCYEYKLPRLDALCFYLILNNRNAAVTREIKLVVARSGEGGGHIFHPNAVTKSKWCGRNLSLSHVAILTRNVAALKFLLSMGADPTINCNPSPHALFSLTGYLADDMAGPLSSALAHALEQQQSSSADLSSAANSMLGSTARFLPLLASTAVSSIPPSIHIPDALSCALLIPDCKPIVKTLIEEKGFASIDGNVHVMSRGLQAACQSGFSRQSSLAHTLRGGDDKEEKSSSAAIMASESSASLENSKKEGNKEECNKDGVNGKEARLSLRGNLNSTMLSWDLSNSPPSHQNRNPSIPQPALVRQTTYLHLAIANLALTDGDVQKITEEILFQYSRMEDSILNIPDDSTGLTPFQMAIVCNRVAFVLWCLENRVAAIEQNAMVPAALIEIVPCSQSNCIAGAGRPRLVPAGKQTRVLPQIITVAHEHITKIALDHAPQLVLPLVEFGFNPPPQQPLYEAEENQEKTVPMFFISVLKALRYEWRRVRRRQDVFEDVMDQYNLSFIQGLAHLREEEELAVSESVLFSYGANGKASSGGLSPIANALQPVSNTSIASPPSTAGSMLPDMCTPPTAPSLSFTATATEWFHGSRGAAAAQWWTDRGCQERAAAAVLAATGSDAYLALSLERIAVLLLYTYRPEPFFFSMPSPYDGRTVLHHFCLAGSTLLLELYCRAHRGMKERIGEQLLCKDHHGRTPLDYLSRHYAIPSDAPVYSVLLDCLSLDDRARFLEGMCHTAHPLLYSHLCLTYGVVPSMSLPEQVAREIKTRMPSNSTARTSLARCILPANGSDSHKAIRALICGAEHADSEASEEEALACDGNGGEDSSLSWERDRGEHSILHPPSLPPGVGDAARLVWYGIFLQATAGHHKGMSIIKRLNLRVPATLCFPDHLAATLAAYCGHLSGVAALRGADKPTRALVDAAAYEEMNCGKSYTWSPQPRLPFTAYMQPLPAPPRPEQSIQNAGRVLVPPPPELHIDILATRLVSFFSEACVDVGDGEIGSQFKEKDASVGNMAPVSVNDWSQRVLHVVARCGILPALHVLREAVLQTHTKHSQDASENKGSGRKAASSSCDPSLGGKIPMFVHKLFHSKRMLSVSCAHRRHELLYHIISDDRHSSARDSSGALITDLCVPVPGSGNAALQAHAAAGCLKVLLHARFALSPNALQFIRRNPHVIGINYLTPFHRDSLLHIAVMHNDGDNVVVLLSDQRFIHTLHCNAFGLRAWDYATSPSVLALALRGAVMAANRIYKLRELSIYSSLVRSAVEQHRVVTTDAGKMSPQLSECYEELQASLRAGYDVSDDTTTIGAEGNKTAVGGLTAPIFNNNICSNNIVNSAMNTEDAVPVDIMSSAASRINAAFASHPDVAAELVQLVQQGVDNSDDVAMLQRQQRIFNTLRLTDGAGTPVVPFITAVASSRYVIEQSNMAPQASQWLSDLAASVKSLAASMSHLSNSMKREPVPPTEKKKSVPPTKTQAAETTGAASVATSNSAAPTKTAATRSSALTMAKMLSGEHREAGVPVPVVHQLRNAGYIIECEDAFGNLTTIDEKVVAARVTLPHCLFGKFVIAHMHETATTKVVKASTLTYAQGAAGSAGGTLLLQPAQRAALQSALQLRERHRAMRFTTEAELVRVTDAQKERILHSLVPPLLETVRFRVLSDVLAEAAQVEFSPPYRGAVVGPDGRVLITHLVMVPLYPPCTAAVLTSIGQPLPAVASLAPPSSPPGSPTKDLRSARSGTF